MEPKRMDRGGYLPAVALALFGGVLIAIGRALRAVDDNLQDL